MTTQRTITLPADQWDVILEAVECYCEEGPPRLSAASAALSSALEQPEPEEPTDEEIMQLMPQQMHEDLAAAARALAEQASTISPRATGIMRIMLNRHAVDLARAVLARWGCQPSTVAHGCPRWYDSTVPTGEP
jgi:hypothetical protein